MRARLFGRYGPCKGMQFDVGEEAAIGRGEDNDVVIEQGPVSKSHARLLLDAETDRYWLEDLDSLNGTEIDGERVRGREPLAHLHVLSFGGCELIFQDLVRCAQRHPPRAAVPGAVGEEPAPSPRLPVGVEAEQEEDTFADDEARALPAAFAGAATRGADGTDEAVREGTLEEEAVVALPSFLEGAAAEPEYQPEPQSRPQPESAEEAGSGKTMRMKRVPAPPEKLWDEPAPTPPFQLEVESDRGRLRFAVGEGEHVVGRGAGCDIQLEVESLSRRHACLSVGGERVTLRDLGSRNGTYLDGQPIAEQDTEIAPHHEISFGIIKARLVRTDGDAR